MYGLEVKDNPAKKTKKSDWKAKGIFRISAHGPPRIRKFFCDKEVVLRIEICSKRKSLKDLYMLASFSTLKENASTYFIDMQKVLLWVMGQY